MTRHATIRWLVVAALVFGSCRAAEDAEEAATKTPRPEAIEAPALPEFGPMGDLDVDAAGPPVALHQGFADREEFQVTLLQTSRAILKGQAAMEHWMEQTFTLVREVVSREAGITHLRLRIKDVSLRPLDREGNPLPVPPQMADFAPSLARVEVHLAVDSRGEVTELEVAKATTLPRGMEELFHQLVRDLRVSLPGDPVAPGATWDDAGELPVEREKSRNIVRWRLERTYLGTVARPGCPRCAVVDSQGEIEEEGKMDRQGIRGRVDGKGRVRKVVLINADTGRMVELRMVSALTRRLTLGKGSSARERARIEELTMELSLTGQVGEENE